MIVNKNKIKILFTGFSNTGKSSIINKYLYKNAYNYKTEFNLLKYNESDIEYRFQIWTTSSLLKSYYEKTNIIVFVFDITNILTLTYFDIYLKNLSLIDGKMIIFVGNKSDLIKNLISEIDISKYIDKFFKNNKNIYYNYYKVSALTKYNIDKLFDFIIHYSIHNNCELKDNFDLKKRYNQCFCLH